MPPRFAPLRYVALGDSYTIGTGVDPVERWPNQLAARLASGSPSLALTANLAVNGFTSRDVLERQLPGLGAHRPEFVSLLIGVNDVVQEVPADTYVANAARILDELLGRIGPDRAVVVSTPDYTVTPKGAAYGDPVRRSAGIVQVNAVLAGLASARRIAFVDVHDLSLAAADDRSLVAPDGLHPSGRQYALWVDRIEPVVRSLLAGPTAGSHES